MALSTAEQSTILEIFGLPEGGQTITVTALVHYPFSNTDIWQPTYQTGNLSTLITAIKTNMTLVSAGQETAIRTDLTTWASIGPVDPMRIEKTATGSEGTIIDYPQQREAIRKHIGNLLGVAVPEGGFIAEIQATFGKSLGNIARNGGDR